MHLIAVVLVVYIVFAEWRGINQQRKIGELQRTVSKLREDKTVWYEAVLPEAAEEVSDLRRKTGTLVLARLSDKRWQKKDGSVDFEAIKRWAYLKDIKNL